MKSIPNDILFAEVRDQLSEGRPVRVRVQGQSMLPFFGSGTVVTIQPLHEEDVRRGSVLFACTDSGHFLIHRVIDIAPERVTLMGDGNIAGTESIRRDRIYGCVRISRLHRALALGWIALRPVRKYPSALLHRICRK